MPHALYRHFDGDGTLLYVGTTWNPLVRSSKHQTKSQWFHDVATITIEWFPSESTARDAESLAIVRERPKHNKTYSQTKCSGERAANTEIETPAFARQLIDAAGGNKKFAAVLGIANETWSMQRICNWKRRGIPLAMHWKYRAEISSLMSNVRTGAV